MTFRSGSDERQRSNVIHRYGTLRVRDAAVLMLLAGTALAAAGCSSGTGPNSGSLIVRITAPPGVTPKVIVSGPGGFKNTISEKTQFVLLAPGSYAVVAATVATKDPIVGAGYGAVVTGSPATVTNGGPPATASAAFSFLPGSGGLWIANQTAGTVVDYTSAQLSTGNSAVATTAIVADTIAPFGDAFDANGNLWVTLTNGVVAEYAAIQLAAGGAPPPTVSIISPGTLTEAQGLAFDASGNLWVANGNTNTILQFTPAQLAAGGVQGPAVAISTDSGSSNGPTGIAFDASGDLWVASTFPGALEEFNPSQLTASGMPAPSVTLSDTSGSIVGPLMIAFDAAGDLWVANGNLSTSSVVMFSPGQLIASGSPIPPVTLLPNSGSLDAPAGLAFDASGDLWVSNFLGASLVEFTPNQLTTSDSPTPVVSFLGGSLAGPIGLAFDPHAGGLPIKP